VAQRLGRGRYRSVFLAALWGVPIPLCSCGVLPAAVGLRKQGANTGATTAFMISTPESGVDSIAITYALLDPIMTVVRPLAALVTATAAGAAENVLAGDQAPEEAAAPDLTCPVDACCDGVQCPPEAHKRHHSWAEKIKAGLNHARGEIWADMAGWFFLGLVLAGLITVLVPASLMTQYLGGGIGAMLLMLAAGVPLYICATASTPIAAALILQGVSPGAALVFLLAGPATNITSLTVLIGVLGKRAAAVYLTAISVCAVLFGLAVDAVYNGFNLTAAAAAGQAGEVLPPWLKYAGAAVLLFMAVRPLKNALAKRFKPHDEEEPAACAGPT
jgi:hypothetical protein